MAKTYTQSEVATKAGVTRKTVQDWTARGLLGNPTRQGIRLQYDARTADKQIKAYTTQRSKKEMNATPF